MAGHLNALRRFYRVRKQRALAQGLADERVWDEDVVLEWLAIFRIPPFDRVYQVRPRGAPCPSCGTGAAQGADVSYRAVFPGGSLTECLACRTVWLVSDGTRDSSYARGPGLEPPDPCRR